MISCVAPPICSRGDEDLLVKSGEILYDSRLFRVAGEDGLRVRVDFDLSQISEAQVEAMLIFHRCVGVMRAWHDDFGEFAAERAAKFGYGEFRDESSYARAQVVGPAIERGRVGLDRLLKSASAASGNVG
jgi:hypothetical protein